MVSTPDVGKNMQRYAPAVRCNSSLAYIYLGYLDPLLPILSAAVLRSAWVESDTNVRGAMWQPLLVFLRGMSARCYFTIIRTQNSSPVDYPQSWTLEAESEKEDEDDDEDEENEDDDPPKASASKPSVTATNGPSQAYAEFLQFLAMGCSGSPIQGYPTILVILSTIPSSVSTHSLLI